MIVNSNDDINAIFLLRQIYSIMITMFFVELKMQIILNIRIICIGMGCFYESFFFEWVNVVDCVS